MVDGRKRWATFGIDGRNIRKVDETTERQKEELKSMWAGGRS